jgi:hypothetical protein
LKLSLCKAVLLGGALALALLATLLTLFYGPEVWLGVVSAIFCVVMLILWAFIQGEATAGYPDLRHRFRDPPDSR